ncbi:hypothetical protein ACOME3_006928 [Neoechinorhynchus agilis]
MSLVSIIMGEFEYVTIGEGNKWLAPIFYFSYQFFVAYILLNMLLAIIVDTYSDVKGHVGLLENNESQMRNWNLLWKMLKRKLNSFRCVKKLNKLILDAERRRKKLTALDVYAEINKRRIRSEFDPRNKQDLERIISEIESMTVISNDYDSATSTDTDGSSGETSEQLDDQARRLNFLNALRKTLVPNEIKSDVDKSLCSPEDFNLLKREVELLEQFVTIMNTKLDLIIAAKNTPEHLIQT